MGARGFCPAVPGGVEVPNATSETDGAMSAADKAKLDGIPVGGGGGGAARMGARGFTPTAGARDLVLDPYVTLGENDSATLNGFIFAVTRVDSGGSAEAGRFGPSPFAALWKRTVATAPTQQYADSATSLTAGSDALYTGIAAVSSATGNSIRYTVTFPPACDGMTFDVDGSGVFVHSSRGGGN